MSQAVLVKTSSLVKRSKISKLNFSLTDASKRTNSEVKDLSRLNVRKSSYGFGSGVPGLKPIETTSQVGLDFKRPVQTHLPTYQLDPLKRFHLGKVLNVIEQTLDEMWNDHRYHETESPALALQLAGECMRKVKAMGFDRYRIISVVTISQNRKQSFANAIGLLWDSARDAYVDTHRETNSALVQVTLFGIYLD